MIVRFLSKSKREFYFLSLLLLFFDDGWMTMEALLVKFDDNVDCLNFRNLHNWINIQNNLFNLVLNFILFELFPCTCTMKLIIFRNVSSFFILQIFKK